MTQMSFSKGGTSIHNAGCQKLSSVRFSIAARTCLFSASCGKSIRQIFSCDCKLTHNIHRFLLRSECKNRVKQVFQDLLRMYSDGINEASVERAADGSCFQPADFTFR
jgi:hypothetical protein